MSAGRLFVDQPPVVGDQAHGLFPVTFNSGGAVVELMLTRHALLRLDWATRKAVEKAMVVDMCEHGPAATPLRKKRKA